MYNYENNQANAAVSTETRTVSADDAAVSSMAQGTVVDAQEMAAAKEAAAKSGNTYERTFKKPVPYNDILVEKITLDWGSLNGQDSLDIEEELQAIGKVVVVPEFSGEYLVRMAARASVPRVGADFFTKLSFDEYNRVRSAARSFLLKSE